MPPPLSQSPFAAVVAGAAAASQPPVSFSAAVLTSAQPNAGANSSALGASSSQSRAKQTSISGQIAGKGETNPLRTFCFLSSFSVGYLVVLLCGPKGKTEIERELHGA